MPKLIFFVFSLIAAHSMGQAVVSISGKVVEESTQLPIEFVNVVLMNSIDSSIVKGTVSDKKGNFILKSEFNLNYYLFFSFIGFETKVIPVKLSGKEIALDIGIISLKTAEFLLKDIQITSDKQTNGQSVDKKIFYTENDFQSQSGSAGDVLKNIPSVSTDMDDEISLHGSTNVTILINGKPSGLMNTNSANALEQIPANIIERIEIITNPSAKYRPDGTAGIINIVLKKEFKPGLNGAFIANGSLKDRCNGNISLNYNRGKLNLYCNYGYRQNYNARKLTENRIVNDSLPGNGFFFTLRNSSTGQPISNTINANLDYTFNGKNKFFLSGNYFRFNQKREITGYVAINNIKTDTINSYNSLRKETEGQYEYELQASYEHEFSKKEHLFNFELSYNNLYEQEVNRLNDFYYSPLQYTLLSEDHILKKEITTTLSCEYENPVSEAVKIEAGYNGEIANSKNYLEFENFDAIKKIWVQDITKTNRSKYDQKIQSCYAIFTVEFSDFTFSPGLSAEQTNLAIHLLQPDSLIRTHYFKLFPSVHLSWELSEYHILHLSYSKRLNRPDPDELNPFPVYKDLHNIESGNPLLVPEQTHSFELAYELRKKNLSFNTSIYHRFTYDAFAEKVRYINDTILLTSLENISKEQFSGVSLSLTTDFKKFLTFNLSTDFFYNTLEEPNSGEPDKKSIFSYECKISPTLNLTQTTSIQINATYRSSLLTAEGKLFPQYFMNAGIRQYLFDKKVSLNFTVSDIFNSLKFTEEVNTPELYQKITRKRLSQIIYIGFKWNFGFTTKKEEDLQFEDKL